MGVFAGKTNGLNDKLRGQIGVKRRELTKGCTMLPPELSEYAVLPVGVDMIIPSAIADVRKRPSMYTSIMHKCGAAPRWRVTSFMT